MKIDEYDLLRKKYNITADMEFSWNSYKYKLMELYETFEEPSSTDYHCKLSEMEKFDYDARYVTDKLKDLINLAQAHEKRWYKKLSKLEAALNTPEAKALEKEYLENYDDDLELYDEFVESLYDEAYKQAKEEQEAEEYEDYDDPAADPIDCGFCAGESIRPEPRDFSGTGIGG